MRITKGEFTNFRTYEGYKEYSFEEGINLIIADNGKGKSSMIIAFRLLMLGLNDTKNLKELINWNHTEGFEIAMEWILDSSLYRSEMTLQVNGKTNLTNRKLFIDGDLVREGATDVIEYLNGVFDPKLTDNALFLRQRSNQIVDVTDSERRDIIKKMQDIDYASKVKKEIEPEIDRIKLDIVDADKRIFALESKTYDPKIVKDLPFFESKYEELLKTKKSLTSELILLKDKLSEKESKEEECDEISANIIHNNELIEYNNISITSNTGEIEDNNRFRIKDKETTAKKVKDLKSELKTLEPKIIEERDSLEKTYDETRLKISLEIESLTKSLESYPTKRIAKYDNSALDKCNKECSTLESEIKSLKKSIKNMEEGKCPTCGRDYEASTIEEFKILLEAEESNLFEAESISAKLRAEKEDHEELVAINQTHKDLKFEIDNKITNKKTELGNLKSQLAKDIEASKIRIEKDIKNGKESLALHEEKLSNIDVVYDSKNKVLEESIKTLEKSIVDFTTNNIKLSTSKDKLELEITSYNLDNIDSKELELDNVSMKVKDYEDTLAENKTIKADNKLLVEKEKADKLELSKELKIKDKLKNNLLENETSRNILLKDFPNYIISKNIGQLEDDINENIDDIYDKSLNLTFKQNKASIELKYGNKDNLKNAKGGLSGAEGQITQLAFVSSYNKRLGLGTMILDEPDSACSDANAEKIYGVIGNSSGDYEQLIIISHKAKMKSYLENNFEAHVIRL